MKPSYKKVIIGATIACSTFFTQTGLFADSVIGGYWENWKNALNPGSSSASTPEYYKNDINNFNHVYYSFLTLDKSPNAETPGKKQWDAKSIYESMTGADVISVMTKTDPAWQNQNEWQRVKIQALIDECHAQNKKFIWAIGGWSDLTKTISDEQIPAFVNYCVNLLEVSGDGIDFDWEHLSDNPEISRQQRQILGKILPTLRKALDEKGMNDKLLGYTTRFNAFWNNSNRPEGATEFPSEGEGIDIANAAKAAGTSLNNCVNWVNIMMYDVPASDAGAQGETFELENYKQVLTSFEKYVSKDKIVMGFEPGGQAAGGIWEGVEVDKQAIDYIKANGYGGIMFWAVNQPKLNGSEEITGQNAQELAGYANDSNAEVIHNM